MGRGGRPPTSPLPDFIEVSPDGKKVRCKTCQAGRPNKEAWIQKRNLPEHLKSDLHNDSVNAQAINLAKQETLKQLRLDQELEQRQFAKLPLPVAHSSPVRSSLKTSPAEQEMWDDFMCSNMVFDAGTDPGLAAAEERRRLAEETVEFGLWHTSTQEENIGSDLPPDLWPDNEEEDILAELIKNANLGTSDIDDLLGGTDEGHSKPVASEAWFPYESKTMFLLDTLDNLPRTRISNSLMSVILWILKETGARDVPSLNHLRHVQTLLRASGVPTLQRKSPKGNVYSINDPRTLVAMDWANPSVCEEIRLYPVIPVDGAISEVYHAEKWRTVDRHTLSPMYDAGNNKHYYIDEVASLKNGNYIIPLRWLQYSDGRIVAEAFAITLDEQGLAAVQDSKTVLVQASDLSNNFLDLVDQRLIPDWDETAIKKGFPASMPNPDRALAEGDPLYTSWIDIFGDDVSGNRSKSWNKHWNIYFSHRNLPRKLLQQEFHVHFVSTSPVASIPEQFHGIKGLLE
ncbi:hypothetical protein CVT26_001073 [Gymnopilus dilepis]|uniref:Uncharacterized protein n=1 Tax=Gymnopilus dilepis TaxID=231916 RepID=A0A409YLQ9_9AGAR|nr:hypothetical protein CVT26_001073 [Gymnopilus dilepis]